MPLSKNKKDKLKKQAAGASISLAVVLCLLKGLGAYWSGSLAVLSSMIDSLSDIVASLITFIAIKISGRPASCDYRYGYGKVEALSACAQAMFIAMSGAFIFYDAILRLIEHRILERSLIGLVIMGISLVLTILLVIFQHYVARVTKSQAILADSKHYSVDILTNMVVIVSLGAIYLWHIYWIDAVAALLAALYLFYSAYDLSKSAVYLLMDRELPNNIRTKISKIVRSHPNKPELHDLRTRDLGGVYMFEFHLELDGDLSLTDAHEYTEEIEKMLLAVYPEAQIIIHQEPKGYAEERLDSKLTGLGCDI